MIGSPLPVQCLVELHLNNKEIPNQFWWIRVDPLGLESPRRENKCTINAQCVSALSTAHCWNSNLVFLSYTSLCPDILLSPSFPSINKCLKPVSAGLVRTNAWWLCPTALPGWCSSWHLMENSFWSIESPLVTQIHWTNCKIMGLTMED